MSGPRNMRTTMRKFFDFPLTRIAVGIVVCMTAMLATNAVLKMIFVPEGDLAKLIRRILSLIALLAAYYFLFRRYEKREITELSKKHLLKESLLGLILSTVCVSLVIGALYFLGYYEVLAVNQVSPFLLDLVVWVTLAAYEEIIFRGIVYRIIEENAGTILALILSTLLFGFGHIFNDNVNIFSIVSASVGGILMALLFSSTRRLWLPIAFHAGWNWAQASFGLIVSGNEGSKANALFQARINGPELITGGVFGPENSIITIGLLLVVSGIAWYVMWKKGNVIRYRGLRGSKQ